MEERSEKLFKILNQPLKFFLAWGNIIILLLFVSLILISRFIYINNSSLFEGKIIEINSLPNDLKVIKVLLSKYELNIDKTDSYVFVHSKTLNESFKYSYIQGIDYDRKIASLIVDFKNKKKARNLINSEVTFSITGGKKTLFYYLFDSP